MMNLAKKTFQVKANRFKYSVIFHLGCPNGTRSIDAWYNSFLNKEKANHFEISTNIPVID